MQPSFTVCSLNAKSSQRCSELFPNLLSGPLPTLSIQTQTQFDNKCTNPDFVSDGQFCLVINVPKAQNPAITKKALSNNHVQSQGTLLITLSSDYKGDHFRSTRHVNKFHKQQFSCSKYEHSAKLIKCFLKSTQD